MKLVYLICFFIPFLNYSQDITKKDKLRAKRFTSNAITIFREGQSSNAYMLLKQAVALDSTNGTAYYWLAETEFDLRSYYYAQEHCQRALFLLGKDINIDHLFLSIEIELALNEFAHAKEHLQQVKNIVGGQKDYKLLGFEKLEQQCSFAEDQKQKGYNNLRQLLGDALNTKYDEYGPILSNGGQTLYFTTRNPDAKGANLNPDDQRFFEDIYQAEIDTVNYGAWIRTYKNDELLNTEGFDALSYVSKDGLSALGTINTTASKENNTQGSDIFEMSTENSNNWDDKRIIADIPDLNTSYFEGSPTKTDTIWIDEYTYVEEIYFVSDRNANKFATDIYVAKKINGIWQAEVSALPQGINTEGRETTPYITPDGQYLFFASDGHPGMGGYDMFYCKRNGEQWSAPINLGGHFNSTLDDTHPQIFDKNIIWASVSEIDGLFSYNLFQANSAILQLEEPK